MSQSAEQQTKCPRCGYTKEQGGHSAFCANATHTCDYNHQTREEVRILPIGGGANVFVCRVHYETEMAFRRERIAAGAAFDLSAWESLRVYEDEVQP